MKEIGLRRMRWKPQTDILYIFIYSHEYSRARASPLLYPEPTRYIGWRDEMSRAILRSRLVSARLVPNTNLQSMSTVYSVIPTFWPNPIAWGECKSKQATYFYICEFVEMGQSPSPEEQFCTLVANMHNKGTSSNGKFGFHITCNRNISQDNSWCNSWEVFFAAGFRHMLNLYKVNGRTRKCRHC
jgi:hypothetical protein